MSWDVERHCSHFRICFCYGDIALQSLTYYRTSAKRARSVVRKFFAFIKLEKMLEVLLPLERAHLKMLSAPTFSSLADLVAEKSGSKVLGWSQNERVSRTFCALYFRLWWQNLDLRVFIVIWKSGARDAQRTYFQRSSWSGRWEISIWSCAFLVPERARFAHVLCPINWRLQKLHIS